MTLSDNKLGMTKEIIATKVLPFLFPLSIENGLTVLQYTAVMGLIKVISMKSWQIILTRHSNLFHELHTMSSSLISVCRI